MDSDEIRVSKNQDVLLNQITAGIDGILDISEANDEILESLIGSINEFQANPQLLDRSLPRFVESLSGGYIKCIEGEDSGGWRIGAISKTLYNLCKIRGLDLISTLLLTDISLFSGILKRLEGLVGRDDTADWHEVSFLLLWLSVLVLSPFELASLLGNSTTIQNICFEKLLLHSNSNSYLNDVNVLLYSKFLSRVDSKKYLDFYYKDFLLQNINKLTSNQVIYNLRILLKLLKLAKLPEDLLTAHFDLIYKSFSDMSQLDNVSPTILKLLVKNLGNLAIKFVNIAETNEEVYLQRVEDIITCLLSATSSKDTVVRYSNAKNIAKITELLPEELQLEILNNVLSQLDIPQVNEMLAGTCSADENLIINFDMVSMNNVHGCFVTLAELLKRHLINTSKYLYIIFAVIRPFFYFKKMQINSTLTGNNIRDSVLYIVWNLLKYNTVLLNSNRPVLIALFKNLLFVTCFDNDLIIRRASSAVVQELIGRYGSLVWSDLNIQPEDANRLSVQLIELLDFNKLNDFKCTFLHNSKVLFEMIPELQPDFFQFLLSTKTNILQEHDNIEFTAGVKSGVFAIDYSTQKYASALLASLLKSLLEKNLENIHSIVVCIRYCLDHPSCLHAVSDMSNLLWEHHLLLDEANKIMFKQIVDDIKDKLSNLKFDFHKELPEKGEQILKLLTTFVKFYDTSNKYSNKSEIPVSIMENLVFNIIRQNTSEICVEFQNFLTELSKHKSLIFNSTFSTAFTPRLLNYVKNGNLTSSASIGYIDLDFLSSNGCLEDISLLIRNKKVSYEIRVNLLSSVGVMFKSLQKNSHFNSNFMTSVIEQLHDYTTSEQGDVGNKVRFETLKLIDQNLQFFLDNTEYTNLIENKLLRLTFEIIDRIKYASLRLLVKVKFFLDASLQDKYNKEIAKVIDSNDYYEYYKYLLDFIANNYWENGDKQSTLEAMKGACLTAGAINGSTLSVHKSITAFVSFYDINLRSDKRQTAGKIRAAAINDLLYLLKSEGPRNVDFNQGKNCYFDQNEKIISCCLNFLVKLADANIDLTQKKNPQLNPLETALFAKKLFIRLYNIEISTKSNTNLSSIIKLYGYLLVENTMRDQVSKRFNVMLAKFAIKKLLFVQILETLYSVYKYSNGSQYDTIIDYLAMTDYNKIAEDVKSKKFKVF